MILWSFQQMMQLRPGFWETMDPSLSFYPKPLDLELVEKIEEAYDYSVPDSLISLLQICNGGRPKYRFFPFFDKIGLLQDYLTIYFASLTEIYNDTDLCIGEWGMPKEILLLSRFEGHCCFALDYRNEVSTPAVVYIDESGSDDDVRTEKTETGDYITTLADSFESFLMSLLSAEELNRLITLSPEAAGLSYVEPDPI